LEAARGSDHADSGGFERVVGWEVEGAPILTVVVGGVWRACKEVVPFKNVGFARVSLDVRWGVLGDSLVLSGELDKVLAYSSSRRGGGE